MAKTNIKVAMGLRPPKIKKPDRLFKVKRQRQDEIWQFVVLAAKASAAHKSDEELDNEDADFAYCPECECKISFRIGKHAVKPHMETYHMREILAYRRAQAASDAVDLELKLDFSKLRMAPKEMVVLSDDVLAMWFASSARPINMVTDPWFKIYTSVLTKAIGGVVVPTPARATTSAAVTRLAAKIRVMLKDELDAQCYYFCVTTDCWTDRPGRGYISLTVHYIDDEFTLKHWTLEVAPLPGRHTADVIADALRALMDEWGLDRDRCVRLLRDGASNAVAAGRRLGIDHMSCIAHCLHLVVSGALIKKRGPKSTTELLSAAVTTEEYTEAHEEALCEEIDAFLANEVAEAGQRAVGTVREIVASFRAIAVYISRSQKASNWLTKAQLAHSKTAHQVVLDCPTRWNSCRDMLIRMRTLQPWIMSFFEYASTNLGRQDFAELRLTAPTPHDWLVIRSLLVILEPFIVATDILGGVTYPTLSMAFPTLRALHTQLRRPQLVPGDCSNPISSAVRTLLDCVRLTFLETFERRFPSVASVADDGLVWITLLEPRFRKMHFLSEVERRMAEDRLVDAMVENERDSGDWDRETADAAARSGGSPDRTPKKVKREMMMSMYGPDAGRRDQPIDSSLRALCASEVENYLDHRIKNPPTNRLGWWKDNAASYPRLAKLVKKWLCCMATTVPSERAFSTSGNTVTAKRCSLGESMVRDMVFLADNQLAFLGMPELTPFRHLFHEPSADDIEADP